MRNGIPDVDETWEEARLVFVLLDFEQKFEGTFIGRILEFRDKLGVEVEAIQIAVLNDIRGLHRNSERHDVARHS